ncbi:hypothetical protein BGX21_011580 [Mortierella sp. AD011]|nr:hypothetical protein BGX21_011580 [Mortierella sp. AD011]
MSTESIAPYPGQPPQQQQQQGAPPPHLRHGPPPPGSHYGPPPPHLQGRPPHMYPGAPPPHLQQPYPPHMQGPPPPLQQHPPHFQARGPMPPQRPGIAPPGQHYPPGSGAAGPYGAAPPLNGPPLQAGAYPPQHQRMPRPAYGPGSLPPPAGAGAPPGSGQMGLGGPPGFINAPPPSAGLGGFNKGAPSGTGAIPASAFVVGGALPDKMNTLFIGSIAPGINNVAMEKLLKTTGNLVKWKRVQDPTTHQWKAFGFAEYADADSLLRTLRVLGQDGQQPKGEKPVGLELTAMDGSGVVKALLVKADEKTRQFLDQYEESRPRTIHDTEKDKVALGNANKIIQKMKDGTLDTSEQEQRSEDKEESTTEDASKKTEDQETAEVEVSEEQKELIARELNFFRERAALKEKEKREEEERAERLRSKQQRDKDASSQSANSSHRTAGRERAWGSNSTTLGTRLTEFVPASGSNQSEGGSTAGAPGVTPSAATAPSTADQDPGVDSEEEERARQERKEREQEHVYKDRERRWEQREAERMRQYEKDKTRDEEYTLELQSARTAMAHRLEQWNDDVERERRHEEYYRDRSRWWQRRQAFLQKEERYDALDREEEKEELEQEAAKKAQEESAALAVDHDGDSEMKDATSISTPLSAGGTLPGTPNSNPAVDATVLPSQPTKLKLSLATNTGVLKRGGSEANSGVGTPTSGFAMAAEFENDDEDKEVKKRRVVMPFKYSGDDTESENKKSHNGTTNGGPELSQEEKEKMEREAKALIQLIPADAQGLWNWPIQWQYVFDDNSMILTEKIRPFASKKVVELLGVQEDELTNFVIEHIRQKKPPQELVDELRSALDSDADVLVMKIWRMLIFETESQARKQSSK